MREERWSACVARCVASKHVSTVECAPAPLSCRHTAASARTPALRPGLWVTSGLERAAFVSMQCRSTRDGIGMCATTHFQARRTWLQLRAGEPASRRRRPGTCHALRPPPSRVLRAGDSHGSALRCGGGDDDICPFTNVRTSAGCHTALRSQWRRPKHAQQRDKTCRRDAKESSNTHNGAHSHGARGCGRGQRTQAHLRCRCQTLRRETTERRHLRTCSARRLAAACAARAASSDKSTPLGGGAYSTVYALVSTPLTTRAAPAGGKSAREASQACPRATVHSVSGRPCMHTHLWLRWWRSRHAGRARGAPLGSQNLGRLVSAPLRCRCLETRPAHRACGARSSTAGNRLSEERWRC